MSQVASVPLHAPPQPKKSYPPAFSVSVNGAFAVELMVTEQVPGQERPRALSETDEALFPVGLTVSMTSPVPVSWTVSVWPVP